MTRSLLSISLVAAALAATGCSSSAPATVAHVDLSAPAAAKPRVYDFGAMRDYLFAEPRKTEGVVVLVDGERVFEEYAAGFDATKRHITYSASKSIGSALVGVAIGDGLMKLSDSVCAFVPPPPGSDPTLCDTTIEHLLRMSSGLAWEEEYADPTTSNVLRMLYGNEGDMGAYVARQPRVAKAGARWSYSSGDSTLLGRALRGALRGRDTHAWAKERFFGPAGLSSAVFESDRTGTLVFSSSCFMTPRDMARFGQLYLDDGVIDGKRVLPEGWVKYTITPAPPVAAPSPRNPAMNPGDSGGSYGAAFWLNTASPTAPRETWTYPDAPADAYAAEGHWGQRVAIVPSRRLVIARVGNDRDTPFDSGPMIARAVTAIEKGPLP